MVEESREKQILKQKERIKEQNLRHKIYMDALRMSKMNFAKDEAAKLKEQSKRNDIIKKMIQTEIVEQKKQKRDGVRQMEEQTREKINELKEFKVKLSKDIYRSRVNEVT